MKKVLKFFSLAVLAAFAGCGKDDAKVAVKEESDSEPQSAAASSASNDVMRQSSREVMEELLAARGICQGVDVDKGRILAVESRGFSLEEEKDDSVEETYDFPDDSEDDFETRRFKTAWKAYADGLAEIAQMLGTQIYGETVENKTNRTVEDGSNRAEIQHSIADIRLDGIVTVAATESYDKQEEEYEFTVAVCQSSKRQKLYKDGLLGDGSSPPGHFSLKEWIAENSSMGMICPQSFVDNDGVWWRVAGVPVDLSAGRNSKKVALLSEKAKRYAYEAAIRTIWVDVSASMLLMSTLSVSAGGESECKEKISRKVCIKPLRDILPSDPFRVKWLEFDKVSPITGKPIRLIVCAIRDDAGARDAERKFFAERLIKERQEAYERGRRDAERLMPKKAN